FGFGVSLTADFKEVCGTAAEMTDHIHGSHGQPGAVGEHADIAIELDQLEAIVGTTLLQRGHDPRGATFGDLRLPVQRSSVEHQLAVERMRAAVGQDWYLIDFQKFSIDRTVGGIYFFQNRLDFWRSDTKTVAGEDGCEIFLAWCLIDINLRPTNCVR